MAISFDFPDWSEATINVRISQLKKDEIIHSPSRGIYTVSAKNGYKPEVSQKLKKLYGVLRKRVPYARFCVWDTKWLNEFMLHQLLHFYLVAEVEKDVLESAFYALSEHFEKVFLEPDAKMFERYIAASENPVIVKQLVTEAPVEHYQMVSVPALEKLLVDILADKDLFAGQQSEVEFIYRTALEKYSFNTNRMKRYAKRRNKEMDLIRVLSKTSANN